MPSSLAELRERFARSPEDDLAYAELRSALHEAKAYYELAEAMEKRASRDPDPRAAAALLAEAGLFLEAADRTERARQVYQRALEHDPRQALAANSLVRLGTDGRDVHRHLEFLERWLGKLVALGATAEERADVHLAMARAAATLPGRVDRALVHFREAHGLDAELVSALDEGLEVARRTRRSSDVRTFLALLAEAERNGSRRIALLRELGRERLSPPVDLEGAIDAATAALGLAPDDLVLMHELATVLLARAVRTRGTDAGKADLARSADLLVELARRLPDEEAEPFVAMALELVPTHAVGLSLFEASSRASRRPDELAQRWLASLRETSDEARASVLRRRLASLYVAHDRLPDALSLLEPLLAGPMDADLAELAVALLADDGRFVDAARLLDSALVDDGFDARIARTLGLLARAKSHDDVDAVRLFAETILELAPTHEAALRALADVHAARGEHAKRRALLHRLVEVVAEVPEKKRLLREIARVSEDELAEPGAAIDALYRLAQGDMTDASSREALVERLGRAGRQNEVASVLSWEALHLGTMAERKAALLRLLELHRDVRVEPASLVATLRAYRAQDVGDEDARRALVAELEAAGALAEVADLHREAVATATNDEARVAALHALARVLVEGLAQTEAARAALLRLLGIDPGDRVAVDTLERLAEQSGDPERLVEALERRVIAEPDARKPDVLVRLARLHEERLGQVEHALRCYEDARMLAPDRDDVALHLRRIYESTSRHTALAELLDELALRAPNDEIRFALLRDRARLLRDVMKEPALAAEAYREMRTIREDDEALLALLAHARKTEAWDELAELAAVRLERTSDAAERRELGMERATVLLDHLLDPGAGEAQLLSLRLTDPSFVPAVARLASVYQELGEPEKLATALWDQLALVTQPSIRSGIAKRLFELHAGSVPDDAKALDALRAWVKAAPFDLEALRELSSRLPEDSVDERAATREALGAELGRRLDRARRDGVEPKSHEVEEAVIALVDAAEILVRKDGDLDRVERLLVRAIDLGHSDEDLCDHVESAAHLADATHATERLRRTLSSTLVGRARDTRRPRKDELYLRAAHLLGTALSDPNGAFELLREAIAETPGNEPLLVVLVDYGTTAGRDEDLDRVLDERVQASIDAADACALLRQKAQLLYVHERYDEAADAYLRLIAMDPDDDRTRARHRESLAKAGRHQDLLLALDQAQKRARTGSLARLEILRELARTWEGPLANRFEALDAWKQVERAAPGDAEASEAIERLTPRTRVGVDDLEAPPSDG